MRNKYKLILSYNGSEFFGWQKQTETPQTVQGHLESALKTIFKKEIKTIGSGRTDAKVHALEQHVSFDAPFDIPLEKLKQAINSNLDRSIRCHDAQVVNPSFRPTNDAKERTYIYLFSDGDSYTPFQEKFMSHFRFNLNFEAMKSAAQTFEGKHDFRSFMTTGSDPSSTIRTVYSCNLSKCEGQLHTIFPAHYKLEVRASGFLKQMIRLIMGAIIEVGKGRLSEKEINDAIAKADGRHIAPCAPPEGLFKQKVRY